MKNNITLDTLKGIQANISLDGIQKVVMGAIIKDKSGKKVLFLKRVANDFMG